MGAESVVAGFAKSELELAVFMVAGGLKSDWVPAPVDDEVDGGPKLNAGFGCSELDTVGFDAESAGFSAGLLPKRLLPAVLFPNKLGAVVAGVDEVVVADVVVAAL